MYYDERRNLSRMESDGKDAINNARELAGCNVRKREVGEVVWLMAPIM